MLASVVTSASAWLSAFQGPRVPDSRAVRSRAAASQIVALDVVISKGAETESTQGFVKEEVPDYMKVTSPLHGTAEAAPGRPVTRYRMIAPEWRCTAPHRAARCSHLPIPLFPFKALHLVPVPRSRSETCIRASAT